MTTPNKTPSPDELLEARATIAELQRINGKLRSNLDSFTEQSGRTRADLIKECADHQRTLSQLNDARAEIERLRESLLTLEATGHRAVFENQGLRKRVAQLERQVGDYLLRNVVREITGK